MAASRHFLLHSPLQCLSFPFAIAPFPADVNVYYWVYPYQDQVTIKGASLSLQYWQSFAVFMLLKFFPISFFFEIDEPPEWRIGQRRLDSILTADIDQEIVMPSDFLACRRNVGRRRPVM